MGSEILHGTDKETLTILEVLGIPDPKTISRIIIDIQAEDVARCYIERYLSNTARFEIIKEVGKSFEIIEVKKDA